MIVMITYVTFSLHMPAPQIQESCTPIASRICTTLVRSIPGSLGPSKRSASRTRKRLSGVGLLGATPFPRSRRAVSLSIAPKPRPEVGKGRLATPQERARLHPSPCSMSLAGRQAGVRGKPARRLGLSGGDENAVRANYTTYGCAESLMII